MFLRNVKCVHWLKNTAGYNIIIIVSNALIVTQNETRFRIWPQSDGELKKYIFRRSFDLILSVPFYIIKVPNILYKKALPFIPNGLFSLNSISSNIN